MLEKKTFLLLSSSFIIRFIFAVQCIDKTKELLKCSSYVVYVLLRIIWFIFTNNSVNSHYLILYTFLCDRQFSKKIFDFRTFYVVVKRVILSQDIRMYYAWYILQSSLTLYIFLGYVYLMNCFLCIRMQRIMRHYVTFVKKKITASVNNFILIFRVT